MRKKIVITYACHCFMISHYIEGFREVKPFDILPNFANQGFDRVTNFTPTNLPKVGIGGCGRLNISSPGNKSHLQINLGKLWLSVFAAVFIAETFGYLKIFVDATGADEKLFRLLRGLLQGIE